MRVPQGKVVYSTGYLPCNGLGFAWASEELDASLNGPVAALLFDDEGKAGIEEILHGMIETEFQQDELHRVLSDTVKFQDWRVGEAIAETWLTDHRNCDFPWPLGRDERKLGSSLPGADLVGFYTDTEGDYLAFGEVKTSSEARCPPNVVKSLKKQLEDIRDNGAIRDTLFRYLAHRMIGAPWMTRFEQAAKRYLANKFDVRLFGFLVRDVEPDERDVRALVEHLGHSCPDSTRIEIIALYLPKDRIQGIGDAVLAMRRGGTTS